MQDWDALNKQIIECERCPRLRQWCEGIALEKKREFAGDTYWGKPIPNLLPTPVSSAKGGLLIVGLAPAAHGANRTGRMFTGDRSGEWLYRALHKAGFANQPHSGRTEDGLRLKGCAITATCHCAPPDNKPLPGEIANCREYLVRTIELLEPGGFLALGQIAWRAMIDFARSQGLWSGSLPKFAHGAIAPFTDGRWLLASYHPSPHNTFTRRLTEPMFDEIFQTAHRRLGDDRQASN